MRNAKPIQRIAIVGFGGAGGIFGNDLTEQGINVSVFDILLKSKRHRKHMLAKARASGVRAAESLQDCTREAELVISAVTATSTSASPGRPGRFFVADRFSWTLIRFRPRRSEMLPRAWKKAAHTLWKRQ